MNNDRTESNYLAFARTLRMAIERDVRIRVLSERGSQLLVKVVTKMEEAVWSAKTIRDGCDGRDGRDWTTPRCVLLNLLEELNDEDFTEEQYNEAARWIETMTVGPTDDRDCAVPMMQLNGSLGALLDQIRDVENKVPQLHIISIMIDRREQRVIVHATDSGIDEDRVRGSGGGIVRWIYDQGYIKFDTITTESNEDKSHFAPLSFLRYTTTGTFRDSRISWFCYHEYSKEDDQNEYPM